MPMTSSQRPSVLVTNISPNATERSLSEFFSFSGEIRRISIRDEADGTKSATVTFKDAKALDTALLLTGAVIVDRAVMITAASGVPNSPNTPLMSPVSQTSPLAEPNRTERAIAAMLARGYVLSSDVLSRARAVDEKHGLTSRVRAKLAAVDAMYNVTERTKALGQRADAALKDVDTRLGLSTYAKAAVGALERSMNSVKDVAMTNTTVARVTNVVNNAVTAVETHVLAVSSEAKRQINVQVPNANDEYALVPDYEPPPFTPEGAQPQPTHTLDEDNNADMPKADTTNVAAPARA
eukprot:jgi/Chlat1/2341/Chrsp17S02621